MKEKKCSSFCVHFANTEKDNAFALYRHYYLLRFGDLKVQDFFHTCLKGDCTDKLLARHEFTFTVSEKKRCSSNKRKHSMIDSLRLLLIHIQPRYEICFSAKSYLLD